MNVVADKSEPLTAIHTDLGAIFVSLELSRSSWLITSLSPGGGEKMSKHSVSGGDFAGLMERFAQLQQKARLRTGQSFRIIVVQEAGLDGFWIHRALQNEGIESHVVDAASIATSRRRRRAKTDKIDGETLVRALLAYKARRTSGLCNGQGAHSRRGRPPPPLPRAQSAHRRESATRQSYQRIIIQPGHIRISAAAPRPAPAAGRTPNRRWPCLPSAS